jgi:hypothetical protein
LCGVNANHQNGKVDRKIRHLQDLDRSSLLQAIRFWPDAINVFLWPYAIRKSINDFNHIPHPDKSLSPIALFSGSIVAPDLQHTHAFGCPMYILDHRLQSGHKISKWEARSRVAINLGPSPHHSSHIGLGLSLSTGLVTPAFHAN